MSSNPNLRIDIAQLKHHRILSTNDKNFENLWDIYSESIPPSEAKSFEDLERLIARDDYSVFVFEWERKIVAFTMMFKPVRANFALLVYLAVANGARCSGIGSAAFHTTLSDTFLPHRCEAVIIEVDSPSENAAIDLALRLRRLNFYLRNGCRKIENLDYLFPLQCAAPAPKMELLIYPRKPSESITKDELRLWLTTIFIEVYGCDCDDERIDLMMKSQPEMIVF